MDRDERSEPQMRQIRIQKQKVCRRRRDRGEVLSLDPRDPDVLRVKTAARRASPEVRKAA